MTVGLVVAALLSVALSSATAGCGRFQWVAAAAPWVVLAVVVRTTYGVSVLTAVGL